MFMRAIYMYVVPPNLAGHYVAFLWIGRSTVVNIKRTLKKMKITTPLQYRQMTISLKQIKYLHPGVVEASHWFSRMRISVTSTESSKSLIGQFVWSFIRTISSLGLPTPCPFVICNSGQTFHPVWQVIKNVVSMHGLIVNCGWLATVRWTLRVSALLPLVDKLENLNRVTRGFGYWVVKSIWWTHSVHHFSVRFNVLSGRYHRSVAIRSITIGLLFYLSARLRSSSKALARYGLNHQTLTRWSTLKATSQPMISLKSDLLRCRTGVVFASRSCGLDRFECNCASAAPIRVIVNDAFVSTNLSNWRRCSFAPSFVSHDL